MKYHPIQLEEHEAKLLIEAIEVWPMLLGHDDDQPVDLRQERQRLEVVKPQLDELRAKLTQHYGHRLTGPGEGVVPDNAPQANFKAGDDYDTLYFPGGDGDHYVQYKNTPEQHEPVQQNQYITITNDQDLPTILVDATPTDNPTVSSFIRWLCRRLNEEPRAKPVLRPNELPFGPHELGNTYVDPGNRFVVSLIVGYGGDEDPSITTPEQALYAAIQLTRDEGSDDTHWYVHDRETGQTQLMYQWEGEEAV